MSAAEGKGGASVVVRRLRTVLAAQGTLVQSLAWGDVTSMERRSLSATTAEHTGPAAQTQGLEKPPQREACSPKLEKARMAGTQDK